MHHVFLLGREYINYCDFLIYNIINSIFLYSRNNNIYYHTSTLNLSKRDLPSKTNNSTFFNVRLPNIGPITYLMYDLISLIRSLKYIKKNKLNKSSIFFLSTRIGIFLPFFIHKFKKYNVSLYVYGGSDDKNIWTPLAKKLWQKSKDLCIQYAKSVVLINQDFEKDFPNKKLLSKIVNLNCDLSTFDISFDSFLKKFDLRLHDYYLMIDSSKIFSRTDLVIDKFLNCDTTKKLVILSKKRSFLYKHSVINFDFFKDNRIICLNIKRFVHLIPHLSEYCHGIIHSDMIATKNNNYIKNNNLNLVLESSYNLQLNLPNTLYFNEKSFLDTIKKADNIQKKCVRLQNSNNDIVKLIDILEDTLIE